jgi:hypothetical protein
VRCAAEFAPLGETGVNCNLPGVAGSVLPTVVAAPPGAAEKDLEKSGT